MSDVHYLVVVEMSKIAFGFFAFWFFCGLVPHLVLVRLHKAKIIDLNNWGWRNMSSEHTVSIWDPRNPASTSKVLNWLRNAPLKDVVGFIQIGMETPPHKVTHKNRHAWEKILFDVDALCENEE